MPTRNPSGKRVDGVRLGAALGVFCASVGITANAGAVDAHRSETHLSSSNGRASIAFNATTYRVNQFLEHPYAFPSAGVQSRNFAFDAYPGIRVGTTGTWLPSVSPTSIEMLPGTGIIHVVRSVSGLTVDEYEFTPMGLTENASVTIVKVTRMSGTGAIDAYSLFNYHLGSGSPVPGSDAENIAYDAGADALYEYGPSGVAMGYGSIGASAFHGSSPSNPYDSLNAGANLANNAGTGGAIGDAVAGLQTSLGNGAIGSSATAGWFTVLAPDADALAAIARVRAWIAGRTAAAILGDEQTAWSTWVTAAPAGTTPREAALFAQSQANLRMAAVTEPGKASGQILASLAPGKWNITWVRDMAYATVALIRSGHFAEAKNALAFQMGATVGAYETYVKSPYQISVVRYFGNGTEESDSNADGPNVEFDGFGLFLWALDEYVRASNDTATLATWWPVVKSKVADVLVHLQEPSGLIAPDSSIWEVHWNGKQRHFAYSTITAANGLCSAARLATKASDASSATAYKTAGANARDAILASLRAPDGTIAQSTEGLASGIGWLDAGALEAINFGLIDPTRHTAKATIASMVHGLTPPSGRGFMRNDLGGWYDSQEWIFVDLRSSRPRALAGDATGSANTFAWNVDQATENFLELSELHDRTTADYAGESPMVGFGAGAYVLAIAERGVPVTPTCDAFASEPGEPIADAGPDAAMVGTSDGGPASSPADSGPPVSGDVTQPGGCGCVSAGARTNGTGAVVSLLGVLGFFLRKRKRTS
ncbi:MAG: glycoside hydrolase family 15 protein [Polyangiaceae bacterium]